VFVEQQTYSTAMRMTPNSGRSLRRRRGSGERARSPARVDSTIEDALLLDEAEARAARASRR